MTLRELVGVLLRRWWLVALVPAVALPLLVWRTVTQPYQSSFRAVVLIPGDTEIPGNSERPELMVLDDLPSLIGSRVFAEAAAQQLAGQGDNLPVDQVQAALAGTRYSRVLTVTATRDDAAEAEAIAAAAAAVLPAQVNAYLVAPQGAPATVQILDPAGDATRVRPRQWFIVGALTLVAVAVGAALALLADAWVRPASSARAG